MRMTALTHEDAAAFGAALPPAGALVGLDLGTKTIGVAVSDVTRFIATPLETIRRARFSADYARLEEVMSGRDVVGLVIGLPLNMDGTEGPRAQSARAFAREVVKRAPRPILFWDERLSTAWAEDHLIEQNFSRRARAEVIDRVAAGYILQGALDRIREVAGA